jgi:hypothetical protein
MEVLRHEKDEAVQLADAASLKIFASQISHGCLAHTSASDKDTEGLLQILVSPSYAHNTANTYGLCFCAYFFHYPFYVLVQTAI